MAIDDDVTDWLKKLQREDSQAVRGLWEHYYRRLLEVASRRLPDHVRREFDEEDVALSAIDSFCRGAAAGRFPELTDRDSLWALLLVITRRKCRARIRRLTAEKRGGGKVLGESAIRPWATTGGEGAAAEIASEPTPEFAAEMAEQIEHLIGRLGDPRTQRLAVLKMEGYSNAEAARILDCSQTTVERRLRLIRKTWSQLPLA